MKEQTQFKLEYKLLFSLIVAGKSANFAKNALARLLGEPDLLGRQYGTPFPMLRHMCGIPGVQADVLRANLKAARTGNYKKLDRAIKALVAANLDLRACTPQELERIPGIGPKTSRFFILWTRPDARYAALDTHILKWMRYLGYNAPNQTPFGKKYDELELAFLAEADKRGMKPAELDAAIWEWCQVGLHKTMGWPPELRPINGQKSE